MFCSNSWIILKIYEFSTFDISSVQIYPDFFGVSLYYKNGELAFKESMRSFYYMIIINTPEGNQFNSSMTYEMEFLHFFRKKNSSLFNPRNSTKWSGSWELGNPI